MLLLMNAVVLETEEIFVVVSVLLVVLILGGGDVEIERGDGDNKFCRFIR